MNYKQTVQVLKALMDGRASRMQLAEMVDANPKSVGKFLAELKEQKMIHVLEYSNETDGRNRVKIYTFGDGVDAEPYSSQSQEARSRKSYLKRVQAKKAARIKTTFVGGVSLWQ